MRLAALLSSGQSSRLLALSAVSRLSHCPVLISFSSARSIEEEDRAYPLRSQVSQFEPLNFSHNFQTLLLFYYFTSFNHSNLSFHTFCFLLCQFEFWTTELYFSIPSFFLTLVVWLNHSTYFSIPSVFLLHHFEPLNLLLHTFCFPT